MTCAAILVVFTMTHVASAQVQSGSIALSSEQLAVGSKIDLTGKWFFRPGADQKAPEKDASSEGYLTLPVPQMLSRIQWWLDDSEDFKKYEDARLKALGFDTEKNDEGWYRLEFDAPQLPKDRHLWIEFDGVAMKSKTFINGTQVGEDKGMFHRFAYDLTPHLKAGKNMLAMWVSMEKIPETKAELGEAVTVNLSAAKVVSMSKGMFGPLSVGKNNRDYDLYGIWQPVKFVVRGEARITDAWFQPRLDGAKVEVEVNGSKPEWKLRAKLTDAAGKEFADKTLDRMKPAQGDGAKAFVIDFDQLQPQLWTPAEPKLYRLDVSIEKPDGTVVDRWSHDVGFRTFEIKDNHFYLNGKPYFLRGANQAPYGKNPFDPELAKKYVQFMHDGNQRFTRTHATPWNEAWLDAADSIGLAVSIEGIRPWAFAGKAPEGKPTIMPPKEIFEHWLMENEDVVKRCRNHPSVFIFTVGNEMMLRDSKNMEKWKLLSEVTKQTRQLAPDHPIICSSDYTRDPEFYEKTLKPAGIDDGDVDDMHRYNGWYGQSAFVINSKFEKEMKENRKERPLMGQEFATGYPDLDTGLPVLRYTRDLLTPQAWIGHWAYPGNDPAFFLNHLAVLTKRWAEQLRYQRGDNTSGFGLFSSECWYKHSYDAKTIEPYKPIYDAVKLAWQPIGVAIETPRRRFWSGDETSTMLHITNDDEQFRDLSNLKVTVSFQDPKATDPGEKQNVAEVDHLPYYKTADVEMKFKLPTTERDRAAMVMVVQVSSDGKEIGRTEDAIEVFKKFELPKNAAENVIVIKPEEPLAGLKEGGPLRKKIEDGATAIVFSPSKEIVSLFPNDLLDVKESKGEFADWLPAAGTKLTKDLQPMDLKWWGKGLDREGAYISNQSHRLKPGGKARELIRFIPPHGYISAEKLPEQYRCVMSEIPIGKGRLWICDLDVQDSAKVDPAAALFARNLMDAASDPESTKDLKPVPTHEQFLKGAEREKMTLD
jgi:hypothetical protein